MAYKLAVIVALAAAATLTQTVFGSPYETQMFHGSTDSSAFYSTSEPDLSKVWNHSISSACSTGIWLYYEKVDYNHWYDYGNAGYTVGIDSCSDKMFKQFAKVLSLRYAGGPTSFDGAGITLYDDIWFQGTAFYGTEDSYNELKNKSLSVIITGASNWTLYEENDYGGESWCYFPSILATKGDKTLHGVLHTMIGRSVRSIKKGCHSSTIMRSQPMPTSHQAENGFTGSFRLPKH